MFEVIYCKLIGNLHYTSITLIWTDMNDEFDKKEQVKEL